MLNSITVVTHELLESRLYHIKNTKDEKTKDFISYPFAADQRTIVSLSFSPTSRISVKSNTD